jgi:hypothetical protein
LRTLEFILYLAPGWLCDLSSSGLTLLGKRGMVTGDTQRLSQSNPTFIVIIIASVLFPGLITLLSWVSDIPLIIDSQSDH